MKAIITGVNGQDGSYLAELLLSKGYEVIGIIRRSSTNTTMRIFHLLNNPKFQLVEGDVSDSSSVNSWFHDYGDIDECYNLAAMSHVATSFKQPKTTFDVDAIGVLNILEAIRNYSMITRFYQASTSEMFGSNVVFGITGNSFQNENTGFAPQSPYAIAKVAAHQMVQLYRKSYGIHASCGILFNHECLTENTPVIVRNTNSGMISITAINEIIPHRTSCVHGKKYSTYSSGNYEIWDGDCWSKIKTRTATWNDKTNDKSVHRILSRGGMYEATADHISFKDDSIEVKTSDLKIGDNLTLKNLPELNNRTIITLEEAEFYGLMIAEGYCKNKKAKFTNKDLVLVDRIKYLWPKISGGYFSVYNSVSGFTKNKDIINVSLFGNPEYLIKLEKEMYTKNGFKKIPDIIINSNENVINAFMKGYLLGDGVKSLLVKDDYQSMVTNSSVLAAGLWYIYTVFYKRRLTLHTEERKNSIYYYININIDDTQRKRKGPTKPLQEVKKITKLNYEGWLYDIETDSGTFSAGIGNTWVHNSPRRGEQFVTRKITKWIGEFCQWRDQEFKTISKVVVPNDCIHYGKPLYGPDEYPKLRLGNLDAYRDWGHAKCYVEAMHLMLQQERPDDYVIATGETHSIREFLEEAFIYAGLGDWKQYVVIDQQFVRPAEVDYLCGRADKAKKVLGWEPKVSFAQLVHLMVDHDKKEAAQKKN